MASRGWTCRRVRCGYLNEPQHVKCRREGCEGRRPKKQVRPTGRTLRDDSYEKYEALSLAIHGGDKGSCAVCGRPRGETKHHREHDHRTGYPRGLACWFCNMKVLRHLTLDDHRRAVAYLERVESYYHSAAVSA